jgi:hypothetical protein
MVLRTLNDLVMNGFKNKWFCGDQTVRQRVEALMDIPAPGFFDQQSHES